jgi:hypothetical protein
MSDHGSQLDAARAVKEKARSLFARFAPVIGVGITRQGDSYAVQVNLESEPADRDSLPDRIDDVPIVVRVVGQVRKQVR